MASNIERHREIIKGKLIELIDINSKNNAPNVADVLNTIKNRPLFIYGAGSFGREIFKLLQIHKIYVNGFLDIKAIKEDRLFDIPVYKACDSDIDNNVKENSLVIFSIVTDKGTRDKIVEYIKGCGFKNILNAQSIRCRLVNAENYPCEIIRQDYLKEHRDEILSCTELWEDYESINIYKCNIFAHVLRAYESCIESQGETQYFLKSLKFNKGFSKFVDCGGYIGDTLEELVKTQGEIQAVASFEPNSGSFAKLGQTAEKLKRDIKEVFLFPCGVSDKTELLSFNALGGSSSVNAAGTSWVQCVALDDVLKGFAPTFIKMDVEGAECKALMGAQKMIKEYVPDLAICVYHFVNHLWDIPLLVKSWDLGYKFYLRSHNACTMETVMYATSWR